LSDFSTLKKYDSTEMYKVYDNWPKLAKEFFEKNYEEFPFKSIDHIVFSGMGGSGSICDVFSAIFSKTTIHVDVVKGYVLPKTANQNTLVIPISVSGNTRETLSILDSAKKTKCKIIAFSSGGKMQNYCIQHNIEYRKIPKLHSPRSSFTIFLYSILKILNKIIPITEEEILESIENLQNLNKEINSLNLNKKNPSYNLAKWMSDIPLIYYPHGLQSAAIRFKNSLQENAKSHVIVEDIIEACHNGIESWEKKSNVQPILLKGQDDNIKTKERWKILEEYFQTKNIEYREITSVRGNILSKLVNLIYFLDYTTIYRAVFTQVDPTPIKSIDFIKKKLNQSPDY
jgi:glucose/mannose-6-phosphate isomerase